MAVVDGAQVGADVDVGAFRLIAEPVVGRAPGIKALVDLEDFLVAAALAGDLNALNFVRGAVWEVDIVQRVGWPFERDQFSDDIGGVGDAGLPVWAA